MARLNPIQVERFLEGIDYPVSKQDLLKHAKEHGADQDVIETLEAAPMDYFNSPTEVSGAIGEY